MKKVLQVGNFLAFVIVLIVNYFLGTSGINGETMSTVSAKYSNLFTPAGYAFSIWGVIYLFVAGFCVYQAKGLIGKKETPAVVEKVGWWFIISCVFNVAWIIAWLNEALALSVLIIILLLISLLMIVIRTRMELDDEPLPVIALVWWPFSLYSGWVTVAVIANLAAYLTSIDWNGLGISEITWTISMILIAGGINLLITWTRNMREFALVGAWALVAIAVANWNLYQLISITALAAAAALVISSGIHGYRNRKYAPWTKL